MTHFLLDVNVLVAVNTRSTIGHRQVMDLYLLFLAVRHKGAVATTDRAMASLAGREYAHNIVVL